MKKYLLFTFIYFQLLNVFAQCTITEISESVSNPKVTYSPKVTCYKCNDGFSAPKGYEWMKPTKIYVEFKHAMMPKGYDRLQLSTNVVFQHLNPHFASWGNNLDDAVNNYYKAENPPPGSANYTWGPGLWLESSGSLQVRDGEFTLNKKEFISIDCGLGYFGIVVLQDKFDDFNGSSFISLSNSAIGFTCGKATAEDAFKEAYSSAYKKLGQDAVAITYLIGVNTEAAISNKSEPTNPDIIPYRSSGSSLKYKSYANVIASPLHIFSSNPTAELNFIKNNLSLEYKTTNGTIYNRDNLGFYFTFNPEGQNGYQLIIPNKKYPIFGNKIEEIKNPNGNFGGSNKQSGNVPKKEPVNTQKKQEQEDNKQTLSSKIKQSDFEGASKLLSLLDKKEFAPVVMKEYFKDYFKNLGYQLVSDRKSSNGIEQDYQLYYPNFVVNFANTSLRDASGSLTNNYITNYIDIQCPTKSILEELKMKMGSHNNLKYIVNEEKNYFLISYSTRSDGFH